MNDLHFIMAFLLCPIKTPKTTDQPDTHQVEDSAQGTMITWKGCITGLGHLSGKLLGTSEHGNMWSLDNCEHC